MKVKNKKSKKKYLRIIMGWIFRAKSPSLRRRIKLKDLFDKHYLG